MTEHTDRQLEELPDTRMTFGEHLDELRTSLLQAIYGLIVGFVICLIFGGHIFAFLAQPLLMALQWADLPPQLVSHSLPESFITYIKIALFAGIFVASPWVFYQLWKFVGAGLYAREKRFVYKLLPPSVILFLLGGAFFMLVVAPISCSFFVQFATRFPMPNVSSNPVYRWLAPSMSQPISPPGGQVETQPVTGEPSEEFEELLALLVQKDLIGAEEAQTLLQTGQPQLQEPADAEEKKDTFVRPWFTLDKYISLIVVLGLAFGLAFQMPLVVFFLGRTGIVQVDAFRRGRKFVFFGIVIGSAMMTPPDVISQAALSIPMYVLYEIGIAAVRIWPRPKV